MTGALLLAAGLAAAPASAGARSALDSMVVARAQASGGLDEAQTQRLRAAFALYRADLEKLRAVFREELKRLDAKVKGGASDAELNASLAELERTYRDMLAERRKLVEDTAGYLTPLQRAKISLDLAGKRLKRTP